MLSSCGGYFQRHYEWTLLLMGFWKFALQFKMFYVKKCENMWKYVKMVLAFKQSFCNMFCSVIFSDVGFGKHIFKHCACHLAAPSVPSRSAGTFFLLWGLPARASFLASGSERNVPFLKAHWWLTVSVSRIRILTLPASIHYSVFRNFVYSSCGIFLRGTERA